MTIKHVSRRVARKELTNFSSTIKLFKPRNGSLPQMQSFDVHGHSIPVYEIGGDHITYLDFDKRFDLDARITQAYSDNNTTLAEKLIGNYHKAGMYLIDVMGHQNTDALPAAMLHQAFLACAHYELQKHGCITTELFEVLNNRFYASSGLNKTIGAIYGEISEDGTFRFIAQGNPFPIVFSKAHNKIVELKDTSGRELTSSEPIGLRASHDHIDKNIWSQSPLGYKSPYTVNQIKLEGDGDILMIFSDGFSDHSRKPKGASRKDSHELYLPTHLERKLQEINGETAKDICQLIETDLIAFNKKRQDDITYVVIKKK